MPAQNAVARRVKEKHRLKRQKEKAKKRNKKPLPHLAERVNLPSR